MSAEILSNSNYTVHVKNLLAGHCPPAVINQVVNIVAGLEDALHRQAQDEVDIELRLTEVEEKILQRLDEITRTLEDRTQ